MYDHVAIAVRDVRRSHAFYTEVMGFELVKVVKRLAPEGGWTKHIFYDTGGCEYFAIWDLQGLAGFVDDDWRSGLSTGAGLPYWINHVAFRCRDEPELRQHQQRWLDHGYNCFEVRHEFIHSLYTRDPDGTLVEFAYATRPLNAADREEALRLLADDSPATEPEYPAVLHRSPNHRHATVSATPTRG